MSLFEDDELLLEVYKSAHTQPYVYERDKFEMYPSSASAITGSLEVVGSCNRQQWYDRKGFPSHGGDLEGLIMMDAGTYTGKMLSDWFQKANVAIVPNSIDGELRIRIPRKSLKGNSFTIVGRVDQIAHDGTTPVGYEFKSIWSSAKANKVISSMRVYDGPDIKHVLQTALYADYGRKELGIYDWRLTYIHIESKRSRTYKITVDSEENIYVDGELQPYTLTSTYARYGLLADAIAEDKEPPQDFKLFMTDEEIKDKLINKELTKKQKEAYVSGSPIFVDYSPCKYCAFIEQCWGAEAHKKALEARND